MRKARGRRQKRKIIAWGPGNKQNFGRAAVPCNMTNNSENICILITQPNSYPRALSASKIITTNKKRHRIKPVEDRERASFGGSVMWHAKYEGPNGAPKEVRAPRQKETEKPILTFYVSMNESGPSLWLALNRKHPKTFLGYVDHLIVQKEWTKRQYLGYAWKLWDWTIWSDLRACASAWMSLDISILSFAFFNPKAIYGEGVYNIKDHGKLMINYRIPDLTVMMNGGGTWADPAVRRNDPDGEELWETCGYIKLGTIASDTYASS